MFSSEDMARLRDLYYDLDVPLLDAAEGFGVPVSTLMPGIIEMRWLRRFFRSDVPLPRVSRQRTGLCW